FDAKTRRNSTDLEDIFYAHIGGMDAFARALLIANDILNDGYYTDLIKERYSSFDSVRVSSSHVDASNWRLCADWPCKTVSPRSSAAGRSTLRTSSTAIYRGRLKGCRLYR